ncbi:NAD(P)H-dependent oxidoreductase [Alkalihalobacillus sp. LMS6]|uniref:NADPH-dependent FMN reductase n=1 Tax=Alkalihalobacillus sp. LMS6 TaxID=2924034 RepID=UPI0020D09BE9|nr:NADPH-dependent FMN reductase [Alkalihalobacillus sp. LMS6]UTR07582.1 NAD(P)H-dependent oxidoreductase [Alkalihalobacillus sp. LMS6]
MNVVVLSGSIVGSKTKTMMNEVVKQINDYDEQTNVTVIDLAEHEVQFSDGRQFFEYTGDTGYVAQTIMDADALIIGTPVFQASIPGTLKNVFDLLPVNAFENKVVSIVVTAGSPKHYLVAEQQLKPILNYMKAQLVQTFVFAEEKDFHQKKIVNDDVLFRVGRLVEDTHLLTKTFKAIREEAEDAYGF